MLPKAEVKGYNQLLQALHPGVKWERTWASPGPMATALHAQLLPVGGHHSLVIYYLLPPVTV